MNASILIQIAMLLVVQDAPDFSELQPGEVAQFVSQDSETVYGGVIESDGSAAQVLNLSTLRPETINADETHRLKRGLNDRTVARSVGLAPVVGWRVAPIFKRAGAPMTVASIQQSSIYVTTNHLSGIQPDDEVFAYRIGKPVLDPGTGEVLALPEQRLTRLTVVDVQEKLMTCRMVGEFVVALEIGDIVRPVEGRISVVALPFADENGRVWSAGRFIADDITNTLARLGIQTLERDRLDEVLEEQRTQLEQYYSDGQPSRIGQLLGAATILSGRVLKGATSARTTTVSIRLLDVRTGEILWTSDIAIPTSKLNSAQGTNPNPDVNSEKAARVSQRSPGKFSALAGNWLQTWGTSGNSVSLQIDAEGNYSHKGTPAGQIEIHDGRFVCIGNNLTQKLEFIRRGDELVVLGWSTRQGRHPFYSGTNPLLRLPDHVGIAIRK